MLAAAFTVMERTQRLLVEAEREVKDFWAGERGEHIGVQKFFLGSLSEGA